MTEPKRTYKRYTPGTEPGPQVPGRIQWDTGADAARVEALCEAMVRAYEAYVTEHETDLLDGMMGVHNFHKVIIFDLIRRTGMDTATADFLRRMAATTFDEAMRRGR